MAMTSKTQVPPKVPKVHVAAEIGLSNVVTSLVRPLASRGRHKHGTVTTCTVQYSTKQNEEQHRPVSTTNRWGGVPVKARWFAGLGWAGKNEGRVALQNESWSRAVRSVVVQAESGRIADADSLLCHSLTYTHIHPHLHPHPNTHSHTHSHILSGALLYIYTPISLPLSLSLSLHSAFLLLVQRQRHSQLPHSILLAIFRGTLPPILPAANEVITVCDMGLPSSCITLHARIIQSKRRHPTQCRAWMQHQAQP